MIKERLLFWAILIVTLGIVGDLLYNANDLNKTIITSVLVSIAGAAFYFFLSGNDKKEKTIKSIIIATIPVIIETLVIIVSVAISIGYLFKLIFKTLISDNGYHG